MSKIADLKKVNNDMANDLKKADEFMFKKQKEVKEKIANITDEQQEFITKGRKVRNEFAKELDNLGIKDKPSELADLERLINSTIKEVNPLIKAINQL